MSKRRSHTRCRRILAVFLSRDFEYGFDFHRYVARKRRHADGGACVPSRLAENFCEKLGSTVYYLGMLRESGHGIDETADFHHATDAIKIAIKSR